MVSLGTFFFAPGSHPHRMIAPIFDPETQSFEDLIRSLDLDTSPNCRTDLAPNASHLWLACFQQHQGQLFPHDPSYLVALPSLEATPVSGALQFWGWSPNGRFLIYNETRRRRCPAFTACVGRRTAVAWLSWPNPAYTSSPSILNKKVELYVTNRAVFDAVLHEEHATVATDSQRGGTIGKRSGGHNGTGYEVLEVATRAKGEEAYEADLALLAQAPFFRGLDTAVLQTVLHVSHRRQVSSGAYFFHQEEPATVFYVLLQGRVRLTQLTPEGHQVVVHLAGPGDGLGIIVALSNVPYPVSAEVVEDAIALGWDAETITHLMQQYSQLALNGLRLVANRFRDLQDRYRELATERVERRVARALLRLTRQMGTRVEAGVLIDMSLSRQDLAEMTGTTLYTVSRILSSWEQQGLVETGRERVVICSPHGLVTIAEDLPEGK